MEIDVDTLFFPRLQRREQYRLTRNGEYYSNYQVYKEEIREDCLGRCIYCDSHENELGGPEAMNLDHFRPETYEEFKRLINDPNNLVWSCRACNRKKWHHWPALGTDDTVVGEEGFIDPFETDRRKYFKVRQDGEITPLAPPAMYLINLLALNRPTPKRRRHLRYQAYELIPKLDTEIAKLMQMPHLSDEEQRKLELLQESKSNIEDRLDFRLR
ncbi:HNH endonuclease signature motif containing protein [Anaerolineales bacterium HSG6]|nr:HNH endonuclease signature motif containing protein [Anaerolineales bacterium HSG6]